MATPTQEPTDGHNQASPPPRAGAVMAILLLVFFLGTSDNQMISPLLVLIANEFGVEVGRVGERIGPAYALSAATAAFLIGPVSDRLGRRRFLLYASVAFAISLLAASFARDVTSLAALRVLTGLAAGTFSTCAIAYVADYFPYERRGMAMSVVQAGYFAALVLGVPLASEIAEWRGWRASFAVFSIIAAVTFLLVALLLPEDRHLMEPEISERVARRFDNVRLVFETRERLASIASGFLVSCGFVGFIFYLGSWLARTFALSPREVGRFFILIGIASLAGALIAGPLSDRFGKRLLSIASSLVLAVSLVVIPRAGWGGMLFVAFLAASMAFAFRQGPLQALATEMVPRRARGSLVAARNTASQIGIAVSTVVTGRLYDQYGYEAVGVFSGAVTLAAAAAIFVMREPDSSRQSLEAD